MCYGQILEHGLRKVRRERPCPVCMHPILTGEQAVFTKGVTHGEFDSWYRHARCEAKLQAAGAYDDGECLIDMRTSIEERAKDNGWRAFLRETREQLAHLRERFSRRQQGGTDAR